MGMQCKDFGVDCLYFLCRFRLSKWAQLTPNLKFHASLAHYGCVLTEFRLLNTGTPYLLGANGVVDMTTFDLLNVVLDQQANGTADLRYHMEQVP